MNEHIGDIEDLRDLEPAEAEGRLAGMREAALAQGGFLIFQEAGCGEMLSDVGFFVWVDGRMLGLRIGRYERYLIPLFEVEGSGLAALEHPAVSQEGFLAFRALNRDAVEPVEGSLMLDSAEHGRLRLREARFHFASSDWLEALLAAEWVG